MNDADRSALDELLARHERFVEWTFSEQKFVRRLLEEAEAERDRALRVVEVAREAAVILWPHGSMIGVIKLRAALAEYDTGDK
jgi:hypothetical protein